MRIGFFQFAPRFGEVDHNLNALASALSGVQADLVVAPELALSGYLFTGKSEVEQMAGTVGIIREGRMVFQDTIHNLRLQSAQGLKLSVSDPEKALGLVRVVGGECTLREGMLHCPDIPDREIAYLVRALVEQGHDIYRIEEQRKSLEDIFMRIVGKGVS